MIAICHIVDSLHFVYALLSSLLGRKNHYFLRLSFHQKFNIKRSYFSKDTQRKRNGMEQIKELNEHFTEVRER